MGVTLQFVMSSGGAGRMTNAANAKYNLLQDGIEDGRAKLREIMDNKDPIPRHPKADWTTDYTITDLNELVISPDGVVKTAAISHSNLGRMGIMDPGGAGGTMSVMIYDMQYDPDTISGSMPDDDKMRLPPSIRIDASLWGTPPELDHVDEALKIGASAQNTGVYLIRSTLSTDKRITILDTAVLQSNNM
jgi:hypothetical protein